jgi:hypothetical protein
VPRPLNPHGGGSRGRDGCPCELCREKLREYRRNWSRKRYGQATREERTVPHGGGVRGKRDCPCELCKTAKRRYENERRRRLRSQAKG